MKYEPIGTVVTLKGGNRPPNVPGYPFQARQ